MKFRIKLIMTLFVMFLIAVSSVSARELKVIHEKMYNVKSGADLLINTSVGDLYLSTWDKDEISIKISGNRKAEDKMVFSFENSNGGLTINARKEASSWFNFSGAYLKYEVKLPKRFNAKIKTAGGNIRFYDLEGTSELKTSGGDIEIFNFSGSTELYTSGGDITVENSTGEIETKTSGGDIEILSFNGDVIAKTSGGDINMNITNGKTFASTSGGTVKVNYNGPNKGIDLSTSGGNIYLFLPNEIKADVDLSTSGGEVECDLSITRAIKVKSSKFIGEVNGGGPEINCRTSGGNIKVENFKASAQK